MQSSYGDFKLPASLLWPASTLGQAIEYLAQSSGYPVESSNLSESALSYSDKMDLSTLDRWISTLASHIGLESEPIQTTYEEVRAFLQQAGPALIQLQNSKSEEHPTFIALLKGGRGEVQLIAHDGSIQRVRYSEIEDMIWAEMANRAGDYTQNLQQMLEQAGVAPEKHQRVQRTLLNETIGTSSLLKGWLLRLPPSTQLWQQIRHAGLARTIINLVVSYFLQLLLTILAWWTIGESVLLGHFEWAWLLGWALILITTIPFQAWSNLAQSRLTIGIGAIFKQRLLHGILQLSPEEIRHQGAGQFLGRVLASDTVEQLGLASGFMAILALFQLAAAVAILALGIGGSFHAMLLLIWVGLTVLLSIFYLRRSQAWMVAYREMTNDLVERMAGHRTRLAQENHQEWHSEEDQILNHYFQLQKKVDGLESQLKALVPRGWMLIGVGGLIYVLLTTQPTPIQVAVSLGGILFAHQALSTIILGLKSVVNVRLAWAEISTLFYASTRAELERYQSDHTQGQEENGQQQMAILTARDVGFRYHAQGRSVLQNCNLQIYHGDRILLEGPSGGGKSTLATILAGLRVPESGLLLLHGLDQQSVGLTQWRRNVVAVPQFHENFVLTGTMAFNLLMGRSWPPSQRDLLEAEALCRQLGLGALLDRMPAGLQQMVGESGWQLSHGERSRLYIARAILQGADLVIMDESFGSLDPESLEGALGTVLEKIPTLLVIAHP